MRLVLKLNEVQLKPVFLKLCEWKSSDQDEIDERESESSKYNAKYTTFFHVVDSLASKLRTIFVPFFGNIWSDYCELINFLGKDLLTDNPEDKNSKKKRKRESMETSERSSPQMHLLLVQYAISSIHKCFEYDIDCTFINKSRFETLMPELIKLLGLFSEDVEQYKNFMQVYLTPCIGQFAAATNNDILWKNMNHRILLLSRHKKAHVRYAALETVYECFKAVGEEYMTLLPECLPFFSEILGEDDSKGNTISVKPAHFKASKTSKSGSPHRKPPR